MIVCAVDILPILSGEVTKIILQNGSDAIIPTLVKHNSLSTIYNQDHKLVRGISTISTQDIIVEPGQIVDVEVSAKFMMK